MKSWVLLLVLGTITRVELRSHTQLPDCPIDDDETFPDDFIIGSASSAYQVEGATNIDGKGQNIWDTAIKNKPGFIEDGNTADIASDSYHKYMEDVKVLNNTGFQSYRFSFSWSRIMPSGEPSSLNQKGLDYYHRLIDALLEHNIAPSVTLFHWDTPQPIQDLGGFLNPMFVDWFGDYADVIFKEFGDKVKEWGTFNEPIEICETGYGQPYKPPFVFGANAGGDYYCAYHLLLAHARAYHIYNDKYRETQKGRVGIVLNYNFYYPTDGKDYATSERGMQYTIGYYAHPIYVGNWPEVVIKEVAENSRLEGRTKSRLPVMDEETIAYIRGTTDWLGFNYYTAFLVEPDDKPSWKTGLEKDKGLTVTQDPDWVQASSPWLSNVPEGFRDCFNFIKTQYNNPEVWVTENGWSDVGQINDGPRIRYYEGHLRALLQARKCEGANITKYFAWSIIDNFEWQTGYSQRFGIHHIDFNDPERKRTQKDSAKWWAEVTRTRKIPKDFSVKHEL